MTETTRPIISIEDRDTQIQNLNASDGWKWRSSQMYKEFMDTKLEGEMFWPEDDEVWFVIDPDASTDIEKSIEELIKDGRKIKYLHTLKLKVSISEIKSKQLQLL